MLLALLATTACGGPRTVHDEWRPGVAKRHGELVGGKQHGPWTYWYESGTKQAEGRWSRDYQDGAWSWWYPDGRLRQTGFYQGSGIDLSNLSSAPRSGHWRFWYANGDLTCEGDYAADRQVGPWSFFTAGGRPHANGSFTAGVKDGAWTWWHANGQRKEAGTFALGLKVGRWTTWKEDGSLASTTEYTVAGKVVPPAPVAAAPAATPAPSEPVKPAEPVIVSAAPVLVVEAAEPEPTPAVADAPPLSPTITAPDLWTASQEANAGKLVRLYASGDIQIPGYEAAGEGPDRQKRDLLGKPLAQTRFLSATGGVLDLAKQRGTRPVLVVFLRGFSGQVCLYCAAQTTAIGNNIQKFRDLGVEVVVVYPGPVEAVPAFIEAVRSLAKEPPPMPVALDVSLIAVRKLGIEDNLAKPTSLIIDRSGVVRYAYVGRTIADRPAVKDLLNELSRYVK
jgi:antitoxin component YwqK of YwqJK toxin-antitoxin module/peroxiredoxin